MANSITTYEYIRHPSIPRGVADFALCIDLANTTQKEKGRSYMSKLRTNLQETARENFKREVKVRRACLDMTQKQLAEEVGIASSFMSNLLANPDKLTVSRLRKIVQVLDIEPQIILSLLGYSTKEIKAFQQQVQR